MDLSLHSQTEGNASAWSQFYRVRTTKEPGLLMMLALCAFIGSIPFEMSLSVAPGAFSITTLIGYAFFVVAIFNMRRCFAAPPPAFWIFVVYFYISTITSISLSGTHVDEAIRRLVSVGQLLLMVLICSNLFRYPRFFFATLWALGIGCFIVGCLHLKGVGASSISHVNVETRETQFGSDPNFQAMMMGVGALALLGLAHARRHVTWWLPIIAWPMAAVILFDVSRTGSRAGLVGFALGLMSFVFMKDSPAKMLMRSLAVGCALVTSIAVMLQSDLLRMRIEKTLNSSDTNGRELIFGAAFKMFKERPLFGYGGMNNQYELFERIALSFKGQALYSLDTHNQILGVATETGLVGLIPFLGGVMMCFFFAFRARGTSYGVISLAILINTVVSNSSGNGHILKVTWLAFALALGSEWAWQREKSPAAVASHPVQATA
jgi:O-antigen ligase